jgi:septal ring factor EnvC (AmiA/AmiB activator)
MTNTHRNLGRFVILPAVFLALLANTVVVRAAAQTPPSLSKKELKTLLATAKTPADQERLAAYYREQAQRLKAKAQEFSTQADHLATQPATIESKQGISCNCASHYRYFSKLYAQESKDAEILAVRHDQLAHKYEPEPAQR